MAIRNNRRTNWGAYAFLVGMIIALIMGVIQALNVVHGANIQLGFEPYVGLVLVVLGLIIGWLNIKGDEANDFLIATIAIAAIGLVSLNPAMGETLLKPVIEWINLIVGNVVILIAPAALVVGLKQIIAKVMK